MIGILAGAQGIVEINKRVRADQALQQAFGRDGCAEPKRSRPLIRFDSGGGTQEQVRWLVENGCPILGKEYAWRWVRSPVRRVSKRLPDPQDANRGRGWIGQEWLGGRWFRGA